MDNKLQPSKFFPLTQATQLAVWGIFFLFLTSPALGQEKIVKKIVFLGVEKKVVPSVQGRIRLSVGNPFSEKVLSQDLKRLHQTNRFYKIRTRVLPYEGGVKIEFILEERKRLRRVILSGRSAIELSEIVKKVKSKKGGHYNPAHVSLDRDTLLEMYRKAGYIFAKVKTRVTKLPQGEVDLYFLIEEGPLVELYDISFRGNKTFTERELVTHLKSDYKLSYRHYAPYLRWLAYTGYAFFWWISDDIYDKNKIEVDMEILRRYYRSKGFFDAKVFIRNLQFDPHRNKAFVTYQIVEGPRYRVKNIFLKIEGDARLGAHKTKAQRLRHISSMISLERDQYFDAETLQKDLKKFRKEYRRHAYVLSKQNFDLQFHYGENTVDVTYKIKEGEKVKIEKISFRGNYRTKDSVIRRYLTFHPGEWFNGDKVEESTFKIYGTRFFENLDLKLEPGSDKSSRNVVIEVKEGRTGSFIFGGGVASDFGFFGNFQFVQKNFDLGDLPKGWDDFFSGNAFVGGGQRLAVTLQPGFNRSNYNILFREPFLFGYPYIFSVNGFFYNRDNFDYSEERLGGSLTLGRRLTDDLIAELTYQIQEINIFDLRFNPPQDLIDVRGRSALSTLKFALTYNRLKIDRNFISYGGFKLRGSYEYAGNFLQGDYDFSKAIVRGQTHLWVLGSKDWKHVISLKARAGWMENNGDSVFVPIFERFFLGGVRNLRGFEFRGVGDRINDVALGGTVMMAGSLEYNFPILGNFLRGVFFGDAGKMSFDPEFLDEADFRVAVGVGMRIRVPVFPAPVQLDFAFPLEYNDEDERQTFHFSLGFNF